MIRTDRSLAHSVRSRVGPPPASAASRHTRRTKEAVTTMSNTLRLISRSLSAGTSVQVLTLLAKQRMYDFSFIASRFA